MHFPSSVRAVWQANTFLLTHWSRHGFVLLFRASEYNVSNSCGKGCSEPLDRVFGLWGFVDGAF